MGKIVSLLFGINILFASFICFWFFFRKNQEEGRRWWLLPIGLICTLIGYGNITEAFSERSEREIVHIEFLDLNELEEIKLQK